MGERKWVERNGSNRPPVSSPSRNWVEWNWVDLEKWQVQGRQHIDFDPSPFDPIRRQSIRPKLFDLKGRPNSFRPISCNPFQITIFWSSNMPPFSSSAPRPHCVPILLSEVEQEQRLSGNGDREAIVVELVFATMRASVPTPDMPHISYETFRQMFSA